MIKNYVNMEDVISVLNDALKKDPDAIKSLVESRVDCNGDLAAHETIQVGERQDKFTVGILGIINGFFGSNDDGFGAFAAFYNDDKLTHFGKLER